MQRLAESSPLLVCYAIRSYARDGIPYVDVISPDNGFTATDCPVIGRISKPIPAPSEAWDGQIDPSKHPLVLVGILSEGRRPIIIDTVNSPTYMFSKEVSGGAISSVGNVNSRPDNTPKLMAERDGAGGDLSPFEEELETDLTNHDVVIENGGTRVVVRADGSVTIKSSGNIVMAVPNNGKVFVGDANANEAVAVAGATYDALKSLQDTVNSIQDWMASLLITVGPGGGVPAPSSVWVPQPIAINSDTIRSAVLKVSSTNGAEESIA